MEFDVKPVSTSTLDIVLTKLEPLKMKIATMTITSHDDTIVAVEYRKQLKEIEKDIETTRTTMVKPMNDTVTAINARAKEILQPVLQTVAELDGKIKERQNKEQARIAEERRIEQERIDAERKVREEEERKQREEQDRIRREEEARIAEQNRLADEKLKAAQAAENEVEKKRLQDEADMAAERAKLEQDKKDFEEKKRQEENEKQEKIRQEQEAEEQAKLAKIAPQKVKGAKTRLKFRITDESKVPHAYWTIDESKIKEAIKS